MNYVTQTAQHLTRWKHGALAIVLGLGMAVFGLTSSASAATAQLYISQGWLHIKSGQTMTATIRISPSSPIDGVTATLQYDPAKLQYVSVDATGSGFPVALPTQTTSSSVTINRGIFGDTGTQTSILVARVTFKVLNSTGLTSLGLTGNATYNGSYTNPTTAGMPIRIFAA